MNNTTPRFSDASGLTAGTSLVGEIRATYGELVAALGQPHACRAAGDSLERISALWSIRTCEGIVSLYDWGNWGATTTGEQWWQIGGDARQATTGGIHPVVQLVASLTGCEVRDARPACLRDR